jgi:hypothetical protein
MGCVRDEVPIEDWDLEKAGGDRRHRTGLLRWLVQEAYLVRTPAESESYRLTSKAEVFLRDWEPGRAEESG